MRPRSLQVLSFSVLGISLLIGIGLLFWYLFLRSQMATLTQVGEGRGFGEETPSFSSSLGSTFGNITSGLGFTRSSETSSTAPTRAQMSQVHQTPIAGHGFLSATSTFLYVERSTGHIFSHDPHSNQTARRTNTLFPRIYEARVTGQGTISLQSLQFDQLTLRTLVLGNATSSDDFLPFTQHMFDTDIVGALTSTAGNHLLTTVVDDGEMNLVHSNIDGSSPSIRFSSHIHNWAISWLGDERIFLTERAATGVLGTSYELTATGAVSPVVRRVPGLTILPAAFSDTALVASDDGTVRLGLQKDSVFTELPLRTIADKCAWAPSSATSSQIAFCAVPESISSNRFIDEWYRGIIHTTDSLWRIDAATRTVIRVYTAGEAGTPLDMERLEISQDGSFMIFRNAIDKSLWLFKITE